MIDSPQPMHVGGKSLAKPRAPKTVIVPATSPVFAIDQAFRPRNRAASSPPRRQTLHQHKHEGYQQHEQQFFGLLPAPPSGFVFWFLFSDGLPANVYSP